jgi:hypothetical protein
MLQTPRRRPARRPHHRAASTPPNLNHQPIATPSRSSVATTN